MPSEKEVNLRECDSLLLEHGSLHFQRGIDETSSRLQAHSPFQQWLPEYNIAQKKTGGKEGLHKISSVHAPEEVTSCSAQHWHASAC